MDKDDENVLWDFFKSFDQRLTNVYERECWKALTKIDKIVREQLGWRRMSPDDQLDRFNSFMDWITEVYLRPSLGQEQDDDCSWSDSGSGCGTDDSIWDSSEDEETQSGGKQKYGGQQPN